MRMTTLYAPVKTPSSALARLRSELARVTQLAELKDTFTKAGGRPLPLAAEEARTMLARDLERWTKLVRAAGLKAD
jgi:tripartite-type tricarboxylate transporter receptor subunit TctC